MTVQALLEIAHHLEQSFVVFLIDNNDLAHSNLFDYFFAGMLAGYLLNFEHFKILVVFGGGQVSQLRRTDRQNLFTLKLIGVRR